MATRSETEDQAGTCSYNSCRKTRRLDPGLETRNLLHVLVVVRLVLALRWDGVGWEAVRRSEISLSGNALVYRDWSSPGMAGRCCHFSGIGDELLVEC